MREIRGVTHYRVEGHNPLLFEEHDPLYLEQQYFYPVNCKTKKMFGWQQKAFDKGKDARFFAIQAFCGSGKSILQLQLAIYDIIQSGYTQKQLVVVPQQHIHKGFVGDGDLKWMSVSQNDVDYVWNVQPEHNFCDRNNQRVLENLKHWLLTPSHKLAKGFKGRTLGGLNAVCSHMALVLVWDMLTEKEKKVAIKNLTLRIDEAHHISNVFLDVQEEELEPEEREAIERTATGLGRICTYIINSKEKTVKLCLTTATMYRGDCMTILSPLVRQKFKEYNLDWIEHFKALGIKSFYLQYEEYKNNPINQLVKRIKSEPSEKHFVVVPSTGSRWRLKEEDYLPIVEKLQAAGLRVLDLVNKPTQDKRKDELLAEPKYEVKDSKYDVVVVCKMGREGTDWCPCSRLHNTACENTITLAIQTIGRPFRRFQGKEIIKIYHYVRQFKKIRKGITKRELFSDRTNAILVCMQLNDMMNPVMVPVIPKQGNSNGRSTHVPLSEIFGDQFENVKKEFLERWETDLEWNDNGKPTRESLYALADSICDEYGVPLMDEDDDEGKWVRWALVKRILIEQPESIKIKGMSVEFIREHFDKIIEETNFDRSIYFGNYVGKDWEIVRKIVEEDWEDKVKQVKEIGLKNIGSGHVLYPFLLHYRAKIWKYKNERATS